MRAILRWTLTSVVTAVCLVPVDRADPADRINSGDLLIANHEVVAKGHAGILKIDPVTGDQTIISKGGLFAQPQDVVLGPGNILYVADSSTQAQAGAVISVAVPSKKQQVVSSGGLLGPPSGVAIEADGHLLVTFGGTAASAIVRVDPQTGAQSFVTMLPGTAVRVAVENSGQILTGITGGSPSVTGQILRIDPLTGIQSVVSVGGVIVTPWDLAVAPNGDIIVLDRFAHLVARVDPVSGAQSVISSGGVFVDPYGIAVAANGDIFVVDPRGSEVADGRVIRIDPVTGAQTIISEAQKLLDPLGISVAP